MREHNEVGATRQQETQKATGASLVLAGDAFRETKDKNNAATLGSGRHAAITVKKPATSIVASPGAEVRDQIVVEGTAIISGANIICKGDSPGVKVEADGRAILLGCHISKEANTQSATGSYVRVENGGCLSVVGCYFHNIQANGFAIDNAGLIPNASVAGGMRGTGVGHNAVLVSGEEVIV